MSWPSSSAGSLEPPQFRPRRRGLTAFGILVIVLGLLVGGLSLTEIIVKLAKPLSKTLTAPAQPTPVNTYLSLTKGSYAVFELTGQTGTSGPVTLSQNNAPTILPSQVTVLGPNGRQVVVSGPGNGVQTLTRGNEIFTLAASFTTDMDGSYRVRVLPQGTRQVVIGPTLGSGFAQAGAWVLGGLAGFLAFLIGLVLIIVARARRLPATWQPGSGGGFGSGRPAYSPQPSYPPGWYTDPTQAGRMRYWDGHGWDPNAQ